MPQETGGPGNANDIMGAIVFPGQYGKRVQGTTAQGATGIALRFNDVGSGYWVVPVLTPDNTVGGLLWDVQLDFGRNMPPDPHSLQVRAVDIEGHWGPMKQTPLQVLNLVPSGEAVATLTWDNAVDLDIQIVGPGGQIDAKHVGIGSPDGGFQPGTGVLDRDSNASCVQDGLHQEDVV